ncbi:hypothetical protein DK926_22795 [Rhodococcus sp. Eu-32]|uniref:hypothetical protein n=1 Tax=Rhodococcus sp. Eu-32 TaxID=1017319 RepID=UPI000DF20EEF|nr:hypothetical protein [Rhodococcus sp. Eu-32]RRQ25595.1 hypothetical protein DK926_22795 [Rhodococcus sp. Eu-32]
MATASMSDLTGLDKTAQLDALRRRMAAIPARRDHAPADLAPRSAVEASPRPVVASAPTALRRVDDEPPLAAPGSKTLRTIPVPLPLAELLPHGALARGTALTVTGAGSVLVGIVAAASAAGHHVAIIGQPKFGLLAVHEHGGDLSKVAVIAGGGDSLEVASICLDGVDLVVTTLGGRDIPPTRSRALLARTRSHAAVLICTDGRMPGIDLTIDSRLVDVAGIGQGRGRLRSITIDTTIRGRAVQPRTGRYTLTAPTYGDRAGLHWTPADTGVAAGRRDDRRILAAAQ